MKKANILCSVFDHNLGEIVSVHCNDGVIYKCRICKRCDRRIPIDEANAAIKAEVEINVAAVMNGERARYGLPPINWSM